MAEYPPSAGWNRIKYTVDKDKVSADLTDYPNYAKLDLSEFGSDFWDNIENGGGSIRVTKTDKTTEVAREVVSCDTATKTGELHFIADGTLSSTADTIFYISYGKSGESDYAVGATYGAENAWTIDYEGVWHLGESSGTAKDSTSNGMDGTFNGSLPTPVTGQIGTGQTLVDGDYINVGKISIATNITMRAWCRLDNFATTDGIMLKTPTNQQWSILFVSNGTTFLRGGGLTNVNVSSPAGSGWHMITGTIAGTSGNIYVDATSASGSVDAIKNNDNDVHIGGGFSDYAGDMDEVRLLNIALSADWVSTEFNNQDDHSTWATISDYEAPSSGARRHGMRMFMNMMM